MTNQPVPDRCVCGDPIEWCDYEADSGWIHSPGSDTRCLDAHPAVDQGALCDRIAAAALSVVEDALGDTLVPAAREKALAGIAAVLPPIPGQAEYDALIQEAARLRTVTAEQEARADRIDAQVQQLRADRAAVLREAADHLDNSERLRDYTDDHMSDINEAANELRRMAEETQPAEADVDVDLPALAAALDGLHTLIATSSRDWGTYRVDAWIWAVLCGWDCEETEHDATCTHGALEETAALHGWDKMTVAKARRYRAAVRALTEQQPAAGARQDGADRG